MIDINRTPEVGDKVRASIIRDLSPTTVFGKVTQKTAHAVRLHVYNQYGDAIQTLTTPPEFVDVAIDRVRVQVDPYETLRYCVAQFKLIAAQDQGLGGNATPQQCWTAAQTIARESINMLGAISTECGNRGVL